MQIGFSPLTKLETFPDVQFSFVQFAFGLVGKAVYIDVVGRVGLRNEHVRAMSCRYRSTRKATSQLKARLSPFPPPKNPAVPPRCIPPWTVKHLISVINTDGYCMNSTNDTQ